MESGLISLEEAQARLLALAPAPLDPAPTPLDAACGLYLGADLVARRTQPWRDLSAMDGYALGGGEGPWRVVATLPAEVRDPGRIGAGEAARIFTGAPLPDGADRILIQEDALVDGERLTAREPAAAGQHVRRKGAEFSDGAVIAGRGVRLTPALIGLAALAGHDALMAVPAPGVMIASTGSELVEPGSGAAGLPNSNGPMLRALFAAERFGVTDAGIIPDRAEALDRLIAGFEGAGAAARLLVLTGGASVGAHDLVRPALEARGWTIAAHRLAVKPGKPTMIAAKDGRVALGLPGNPVAAFVTAQLFALPLLRAMGGARDPLPRMASAQLAAPLAAGDRRLDFRRATIDEEGRVHPMATQDSAGLAALARAQCLIRVPIGAEARAAGDWVDILPIA